MTDFYADYITKTTFDPDTHSVKTKFEEAATDTKKKPASKTPKVEVEPTIVPEELHGDQHKLDHNKDNKIDKHDMKMVRKKGAVKNHPMEAEENPPLIIKSKKPVSSLRRSSASRPKGVAEDNLEEGTFKVEVEGLPTMYMDGSVGDIKASLRKKFKDPKAVVSVERITSAEKKKELRAKVAEGYSPREVKMAIGIASDKRYAGGNMTGAVKAIDKIKKGLSGHKQVMAVLKRQNEDVAEDQAAMDAYLKKGGTVKKLPPANARSSTDLEKDVKGRVDTSTFKTRGKIKSMEDVEQVDELDKKTMGSYVQKSADDMSKQADRMARAGRNDGKMDDAAKKFVNRRNGIKLATKKMGEEAQVNEISNRAKGAYVRVAARDAAYQSAKGTSAIYNNDAKDSKRKEIQNADRIRNNRMQGIDRATRGMKNEGAMKRIATQDAEKERLGDRKVKGDGLDNFKKKYPDHLTLKKARAAFTPTKGGADAKKPMGEKFANAAQQAAVMAKLKASGDYKKPKESVEEKDTHVTKDGKTAKKGLWYNIHKKRARGEAPAKPGDPDRPSAADLKRSQ